MENFKRFFVIISIVCLVVFTTGCKAEKNADTQEDMQTVTGIVDGEVVGQGEKRFILEIIDKDKNKISITVNTGRATVGRALTELDIITGEDGPYGMYIKSVNGITADFDKDKTYWAFYINGEYAMAGIELTEIEKGRIYSLKVEK